MKRVAKRYWQAAREGGKRRKRPEASPSQEGPPPCLAEPPWARFAFGKTHSPLAPPPASGYAKGGGGVAVGRCVALGDHHFLSGDEHRWLLAHELNSHDIGVLREVQKWDAEMALRINAMQPEEFHVKQGRLWSELTERSCTSSANSSISIKARRRVKKRSTS